MTYVLIVLAVLIVLGIILYNNLVRMKIRVDEAWADIEVQLKRRYDLVPNLVETVKGYMQHEREVFEKVTEARTKAMEAKNLQEKAESENQFSQSLKSLFAVAENYPQLKANENFLELQKELVDTEDKIQAARRFYNGSVRDYNIAIDTFPSMIFAKLFKFTKREMFETTNELEKEPVKVKF